MLDSSVVNVAVEPIARELHASLTTCSGRSAATCSPSAPGWPAPRTWPAGSAPCRCTGPASIAFTAASALCALAPDAGVLVAARVVQGLVAAPLVPLAMSMLLGRGPSGASAGGPAISPVAGIMLFLGPALGPTVGGALIGAGGWRAIFLINVPVGALAAVAVRYVPAALAPGRHARSPVRPARADPARGGPDRAAVRGQPGRRLRLGLRPPPGPAGRGRGAAGRLRRLGGAARAARARPVAGPPARCPPCPWRCARWPRW